MHSAHPGLFGCGEVVLTLGSHRRRSAHRLQTYCQGTLCGTGLSLRFLSHRTFSRPLEQEWRQCPKCEREFGGASGYCIILRKNDSQKRAEARHNEVFAVSALQLQHRPCSDKFHCDRMTSDAMFVAKLDAEREFIRDHCLLASHFGVEV